MPLLQVKGLAKRFGAQEVLSGVDLRLEEGEIVSLLGVSGSGKSTLFNLISGLLRPDAGQVLLRGEDITGQSGRLAYMLQKHLLLPHLSVLDNVCLPLLIKGRRRSEARASAAVHLRAFGLEGFEHCYPGQISGGMAQRAALLRTYMMDSAIALLDEPFSALDAITKAQLHDWFLDISAELGLSTLLITHDVDEALKLSDRVYLLAKSSGRILREFKIEASERRSRDFALSTAFLDYKRAILAGLGD